MTASDDRIAELIAAALAGELTDVESVELDGYRQGRPWIDDELRDLGILSTRLRRGDITWTPPRDLDLVRARVLGAIGAAATTPPTSVGLRGAQRRRRWIPPLAGAACVAAGLAIGFAVPGLVTAPPSGPPGTLGAVEAVEVADDVAGVDVQADLVAHTWGTEAILQATGLDVGETYQVVFIGPHGAEFSGGAILGSEVPVICRVNAAVLRGDATRFEIRDDSAAVVAHADLPAV